MARNITICILSMISLCSSFSFLCKSFDERTKALELYGESFKGIVPFEHCIDEIESVDPTQVKQLKIGGCDCDIVSFAIDRLKYIRSLDISYSYGYESLDWLNLRHEWLKKLNASHIELLAIPKRFFQKTFRMTEIDLSHNYLRRIDVNTFTGAGKLMKINLSHNRIWIIQYGAFDRLIDLEYLDLSSNSIKTLGTFNANTNLKCVHAENNPITEIPHLPSVSLFMSWKNVHSFYGRLNSTAVVQNNTFQAILPTTNGTHAIYCTPKSFENLQYFIAGRNKFVNVLEMLQCLGSHLKIMDLSGNNVSFIKSTTLRPFDDLEELNLSGTMLKSFDFDFVKNPSLMRKLDISNNNIQRLPHDIFMQDFFSLRIFNAAGNHLDHTQQLIGYLPPLIEDLDLSGNYVGQLFKNVFGQFEALNTLKLSNTMLSFSDTNPFKSLERLNHLDISRNDLSYVNFATFAITLSKLKSLNAASSRLVDIHSVVQQLSKDCRALDLSGNNFGLLNGQMFVSVSNLEYLNLSNTLLTISNTNPFENLKNLRVLDISRNDLKELNFTILSTTLNQLLILNASYCYIENASKVIQYLGASILKLDLSGNSIKVLNTRQFESLTKLMYLDVSNSNLTNFDIDFLWKRIYPIELHLSNNQIREIGTRSKLQSSKLSLIDLRGNDLTNIDRLLHNQTTIRNIDISQNRFSCEYLTKFLIKWTHLRFINDPWNQKYRPNCHRSKK